MSCISGVSSCSQATVIRVRKINDKNHIEREKNRAHTKPHRGPATKQQHCQTSVEPRLTRDLLRKKQYLLRALQHHHKSQVIKKPAKLNESYYSDDFECEQSRQRLKHQMQPHYQHHNPPPTKQAIFGDTTVTSSQSSFDSSSVRSNFMGGGKKRRDPTPQTPPSRKDRHVTKYFVDEQHNMQKTPHSRRHLRNLNSKTKQKHYEFFTLLFFFS